MMDTGGGRILVFTHSPANMELLQDIIASVAANSRTPSLVGLSAYVPSSQIHRSKHCECSPGVAFPNPKPATNVVCSMTTTHLDHLCSYLDGEIDFPRAT
ncbi:hypothetical protein Hypma_016591 [Hypsizygus marmoreus]|uniref:Uncharacterized protein n=1 Tax=Hypsizygus marmoreus TaxID=39966 RepID=A0A369IYD1_HYPMA|nr:hypothetical protein Hypma_016591 [Hypsizygus marmoreus]